MTILGAGRRAPPFSLLASSRDEGEEQMSLTETDFRGRPLILAFYPADWSPVCGDQMALYNAVLPEFERLGAALLGVSVDGVFCHRAFARDRHLRFPLMADFEPKGKMSKDYGVYNATEGTAERALFVLDGEGMIRWSYVSPVDVNPGAAGILRALECLPAETTKPLSVELLEFGDYECPYCRMAHPIVKQLKQRFGSTLDFRFRNFPLSQIHEHAEHAAEAAVSVRSQIGENGFWAMHDAIFAHQGDGVNALDDVHLARYAEDIGADGATVLSDLATGKYEETVEVDFVEGVRMGVNGTPTFFIDGTRFDGDWANIAEFAAAIDAAVSRKTLVEVH
jgi:peroxiredoxin/predicted DsbA family dithiol-disulfide isomerase